MRNSGPLAAAAASCGVPGREGDVGAFGISRPDTRRAGRIPVTADLAAPTLLARESWTSPL